MGEQCPRQQSVEAETGYLLPATVTPMTSPELTQRRHSVMAVELILRDE